MKLKKTSIVIGCIIGYTIFKSDTSSYDVIGALIAALFSGLVAGGLFYEFMLHIQWKER